MKINWKVRFKNVPWLTTFISLIVGFAFNVLRMLDIYPTVTQNQILEPISQVLTFLGLVGVMVDPTTAGLSDSDRAMNYVEPGVMPEPADEEPTEEDHEAEPYAPEFEEPENEEGPNG